MTVRIGVSLALLLATMGSQVAHAAFPRTPLKRCGDDAVIAGTVCLDLYEASVWRVPSAKTENASLVRAIQLGRATTADLVAGGATQLGTSSDDYAPCTDDGQTCTGDIFAVSLPSLVPSTFITWFQAQEACANAGKRLPTSAEWQVGANGTPDPGGDDKATTCNSATGEIVRTGTRRACVSSRGAFDMVGNVMEWVSDWVPQSTVCTGWGSFSDDFMCLAGASTTTTGPGALVRGGFYFGGEIAGPLMVVGTIAPTRAEDFLGFRCAR